jgi:hypothetical protein
MMQKTNEPHEIVKARELLSEFEKSTGVSKKALFTEGMRILNDFLAEDPNSEFSQRANNLKNVYTKSLIKRLGTTPFSNADDWINVLAWVIREFSSDEREKFGSDPELKDDWNNFLDNIPYLKFK